ncbi:PilZ domain-containing protein [Aestuariirhabdus litorea]|uniref:PilZ domain-containing protein n=1 Tax=Aestuariirhabdus litorea TaxID=2528527 RepID=A0A3P3VWP1_9GAMM|nr:PilZ domain-containing protein [Aestuariirhabdus litorea]RRJ85133.1 hypothetical protein D0544_08720 [Aestuariirhabdus litorea]RWW98356.1 hypothetical protein DZC74_08710 [Endozoicomonadaceae bacterium GTF-13]
MGAKKDQGVNPNRRMKERLPIPDLSIRVRQRSIFSLASDWRAAAGVDFNRYGLALQCNMPYKKGNRLYLSFRGPYISLDNVAAQVVSCERSGEGFRVGAVFLYWQEEEQYDVSFDNSLSRIERIYHDQYYSKASA